MEAALARARADLDELREEPAGLVRIAGVPSALEVLVPPLLTALAGTAIDLAVTDTDIAEHEYASLAGDADLVVAHTLDAAMPRGAGGLLTRTLAREALDVAVPEGHRLARCPAVRAVHLAAEPWIGVPEGYPFDTVRLAVEAATGVSIEPVQRLRDNALVAALVAAGHGIAILPRFSLRPRAGVVTVPLVDVRSSRYVVALARPDRAERAAVRRVLDLLEAAGAEAERG